MQTLKESLRQNIIDEARREFAALGYARASMKVIAARCGISVGGLYKYFAGKEQLFAAVVEPAVRALRELADSRDAEAFYALVMARRVELRILLFRGRDNASAAHDAADVCGRMCALWLHSVLERILMHTITREERVTLILQYIKMKQAVL